MNRRDFAKGSLLTLGSSLLPFRLNSAALANKETSESLPTNKRTIEYIRDEIPQFEIPPYAGRRYEDKVPDTLDIVERAKLGIHALTSITDPDADCEIFWKADFFRNPPVMVHDFNDWVQIGEGMMEALPLLRVATGDGLNSHVDPVWMKMLLKCIGPDGLIYIPLKGRPWSRYHASEVEAVWRADGSQSHISDDSITQFTNGFVCARSIATMTVYYLRDRNPIWKQTIERTIERLSALKVDREDYCYLPPGSFEPNAKVSSNAEIPTGLLAEEWNGRLIQGLSQYYKVTGYEPARELAAKLVKFYRYHSKYYDEQGRFLAGQEKKYLVELEKMKFLAGHNAEHLVFGGHAHAHAVGLLSVLEYATAVNDRETMEFVRASYEWTKTQGSPLVGFFPEFFTPGFPDCETDIVADMLGLAAKLSGAGVADCWDDIDRCVRNHFAEAQLTDVDWVYRMASREPRRAVASNETAERTPERNIGAWAGWASANDWTIRIGIQHCCTGNSARAIYYVWSRMVEYKDGLLQVNLLLNRAATWADVYSYLPYEGRVDVKIKKPCKRLLVRAPEWIKSNSGDVLCTSGGLPRHVGWEGRYLDVGVGKPGELLAITFPVGERTVKETIGNVPYTLVIKGSTVVSIDPPGKNEPLYQHREQFRENRARWRKVRRFVAEESIEW